MKAIVLVLALLAGGAIVIRVVIPAYEADQAKKAGEQFFRFTPQPTKGHEKLAFR
jgi:hypothetical protein